MTNASRKSQVIMMFDEDVMSAGGSCVLLMKGKVRVKVDTYPFHFREMLLSNVLYPHYIV